VNKGVDDWVKKDKQFHITHGGDPCPSHCKILFRNMYIQYLDKDDEQAY
jgi:hypothetical protein